MKTDGTMAQLYEKWFGVAPAADGVTVTPMPIPTSAEG
jgi:polar amino acid transport system substrate-binding protein